MRGASCVAWLFAAAAAVGGCDDVQQHVYSGFLFDPVNRCVSATSTAIDVVPGAATGNSCRPVCLTATSGAVYVSPVCGPYPSGTTVEAADAAIGAGDPCTAALAAYDQADGGGVCVTAGAVDGGGDGAVDGGGDGGGDGGSDAADAASATDSGDGGRNDGGRD